MEASSNKRKVVEIRMMRICRQGVGGLIVPAVVIPADIDTVGSSRRACVFASKDLAKVQLRGELNQEAEEFELDDPFYIAYTVGRFR